MTTANQSGACAKPPEDAPLYSIRRGGEIYAQSHIVNLGYPAATLRALASAGYALYRDNKRVKLTTSASAL